ncbi:MAG: hypothetical protein AAGA50_11350 [Pseudomonadota bacterium]
MRDSLAKSLKDWDGKATAPLEELFSDYREHPGFLVTLVEFCETEELQRGATWLLKHHHDQKLPPLPEDLTLRHLSALPELLHWEAKLHALQYLDCLIIPDGQRIIACSFVEKETDSENKFVRAWAFYGLATLANRFPDLRDEAWNRLQAAALDETAGSVKVRIRKALEKLNTQPPGIDVRQ